MTPAASCLFLGRCHMHACLDSKDAMILIVSVGGSDACAC